MPSSPAPGNPLAAIGAFVLRAVFAVVAVLFTIGAVLVALVLAIVLVIWALVRGRRPTVNVMRWPPGMRPGQPSAGGAGRTPPGRGEVIDVAAREVPENRSENGQ